MSSYCLSLFFFFLSSSSRSAVCKLQILLWHLTICSCFTVAPGELVSMKSILMKRRKGSSGIQKISPAQRGAESKRCECRELRFARGFVSPVCEAALTRCLPRRLRAQSPAQIPLAPAAPLINMPRPFYLFISASLELWVYWYVKGEKQAYVQLLNQPFLSAHSVISVSHYSIITI